jgi:hypothetical protein
MIAGVFLVIQHCVLWLLFSLVQVAAALSLVALVMTLVVIAGAYGFSFLGFCYLFGQSNIDWVIFAAMFLSTHYSVHDCGISKNAISGKKGA